MFKYKFSHNDKRVKKFFEANGYVVVNNIFNKQKCVNFLKLISKYADKDFAPILNPDRKEFLIPQIVHIFNKLKNLTDKAEIILNINNDCQYFRDVMYDKKIINVLEKIKNKKIFALMSQMLFKKAKTKYAKQAWKPHQDNSYPKNKNGEYITINIFLNKSTFKNGTMYVWEKSHKYGIFNFKKRISYRENNSKPGNLIQTRKRFLVRTLDFNKGDLLILNGNLVHGSYANKSNISRPLFSVSYIPENEKFIAGKNAQRKILSKKIV